MTIRERIKTYQNEILAGNLQPDRASEIMAELSALIGNLNDEITLRDMAYNEFLLECYDREATANRARIKANTGEEYKAMREARNAKELAVEMIRSLKYFLKAKEEERQTARFQ
jgi:hypothetical protein